MNKRQMIGAVVAMAAASVLAAGSSFAEEKKAEDKKAEKKPSVKCMGGNACSGKGACGAADKSHACAGKNSCKGKGWTMVENDKACTDAGGKVEKTEKKAAEKPAEHKS